MTAVLAFVPLVVIKSMATTRRKAKSRTGEENEGLPRGGRGIGRGAGEKVHMVERGQAPLTPVPGATWWGQGHILRLS